jgi:hypothetical protein
MEQKRNVERAFKWIVNILQKRQIPFQISGGLAARTYGSMRALFDIDIAIPDSRMPELLPEVGAYVTFGPDREKGATWDLLLLSLKYQDVGIDIAGEATVRVFDRTRHRWVSLGGVIFPPEMKKVYGVVVPVMAIEELIAYKKILMRDVDIVDIEAIQQ